jgi:hypothetical protein
MDEYLMMGSVIVKNSGQLTLSVKVQACLIELLALIAISSLQPHWKQKPNSPSYQKPRYELI